MYTFTFVNDFPEGSKDNSRPSFYSPSIDLIGENMSALPSDIKFVTSFFLPYKLPGSMISFRNFNDEEDLNVYLYLCEEKTVLKGI